MVNFGYFAIAHAIVMPAKAGIHDFVILDRNGFIRPCSFNMPSLRAARSVARQSILSRSDTKDGLLPPAFAGVAMTAL
jgi:hypothetical protein